MDPILDLAEQLGRAIAQSPQSLALHAAREELNEHADLVKLLGDYQAQADKMAQLEEQNKPVEVNDKHRLQDLHDKLVASDVFKRFTAAQVEYIDLMRTVNEAIRGQVGDTEPQEE